MHALMPAKTSRGQLDLGEFARLREPRGRFQRGGHARVRLKCPQGLHRLARKEESKRGLTGRRPQVPFRRQDVCRIGGRIGLGRAALQSGDARKRNRQRQRHTAEMRILRRIDDAQEIAADLGVLPPARLGGDLFGRRPFQAKRIEFGVADERQARDILQRVKRERALLQPDRVFARPVNRQGTIRLAAQDGGKEREEKEFSGHSGPPAEEFSLSQSLASSSGARPPAGPRGSAPWRRRYRRTGRPPAARAIRRRACRRPASAE